MYVVGRRAGRWEEKKRKEDDLIRQNQLLLLTWIDRADTIPPSSSPLERGVPVSAQLPRHALRLARCLYISTVSQPRLPVLSNSSSFSPCCPFPVLSNSPPHLPCHCCRPFSSQQPSQTRASSQPHPHTHTSPASCASPSPAFFFKKRLLRPSLSLSGCGVRRTLYILYVAC